MSYNKIGFTSGQTLKAEHLNHMEEGIANAGGVKSWNDLEDKPFYESVSYGDTLLTNCDALSSEDVVMDNAEFFIKVSDAIPTVNDLINGVIIRCIEAEDEFIMSYDEILSQNERFQNEQLSAGVCYIGPFVAISSDNFTMNVNGEDVVFPEKGTYIFSEYGRNDSYSLTIPGYNDFKTTVIKKIDEKYLPAVGATKFYSIVNDINNYLHTSADTSEETRVHSKDIDAAVSRGTIVVYSVVDNGNIDCILYPRCIFPGASGYWISVDNDHGTQFGYMTSDYTSNVE